MSIYYHGTDKRNVRSIENGWLGTIATDENMDLSSGETAKDGFVFLTKSKEIAAEYGDCVFVVDTELARYWRDCPVTGDPEHIVPADALNEEGAWWVDEE